MAVLELGDVDPVAWWYTQEVNVLGTFGVIQYSPLLASFAPVVSDIRSPSAALPELQKTRGQIVAISSGAAHLRLPSMADYHISKHTVNRLIELVSLGM